MKAPTSAKTTLEALTDEMANPRIAASALEMMQSLIEKSRRLAVRVLQFSVRVHKKQL
jgi:hypothetical protein